MKSLRGTIRDLLPEPFVAARRNRAIARMRAENGEKSTQAVFSAIYERGEWGDGDEFDSGSGSRDEPSVAYVQIVREIIRNEGARRVVDVGCGDFRVASGFVDACDSYIGVDVVPSLIARNRRLFGSESVRFDELDASAGELPDGDICLIRQVLQHLSNGEIEAILTNCAKYRLVVVTEHAPSPSQAREANTDKPHGGDTRIVDGSWVDISLPPFSRSRVVERLTVTVPRPLVKTGEVIRTWVWTPGTDLPD